jgi:hypothetical protein
MVSIRIYAPIVVVAPTKGDAKIRVGVPIHVIPIVTLWEIKILNYW